MIYKKRDFPAYARLPNIKFDINELLKDVNIIGDEWTNVYQANRGLCAAHETLANSNYHHFDQISLTYFEQSLNVFEDIETLKNECRTLANSGEIGLTATQRYRAKVTRSKSLHPAMNEHNWFHPLPIYENTEYIKQAIESQFTSTPIRVRLTRIAAGKYLTPHIDYDADYAVRIIVPICGTSGVKNVVNYNGNRIETEMEADGSAYFLNVGFQHSVEHNGMEDRIALMFSLPTQEDVHGIVIK